ncbi:hypothetical protein MBANPS3_003079 [Mucor bainieri]
MKLRDKARRIASNIKQEDCKPALSIIESSTSIPSDTSTADLVVKQEDAKEHKGLFKQQDEFVEKGYYYCCDICKTKITDLKSVLEHRKSTHQTKTSDSRTIKHMNTEPDIHDVNFYCKSCERRCKNKKAYRAHLRTAHYMTLKPLPSWKAPRNDMVPDPDDPNLYCRACDHTYRSPRKKSRLKPDANDPNNYCRACQKTYPSKGRYRVHLRLVHQMTLPPLKLCGNRGDLPDADDPHYHCSVCNKSWETRAKYRSHGRRVHFMVLKHASITNPEAAINVNDPDWYCGQCEYKFSCKRAFKIHLREIHPQQSIKRHHK